MVSVPGLEVGEETGVDCGLMHPSPFHLKVRSEGAFQMVFFF